RRRYFADDFRYCEAGVSTQWAVRLGRVCGTQNIRCSESCVPQGSQVFYFVFRLRNLLLSAACLYGFANRSTPFLPSILRLSEPVWTIGLGDSCRGRVVIQALDVDARAAGPDGRDR